MKTLRRLGIALGSLVAAWLCISLVAGQFLGPNGGGIVATVIAIVLGALIYRDIIRRETTPS
jgi:hypothetical protein